MRNILCFNNLQETNMDDKTKPEDVKQIRVNTTDEMSRGRYSNGLMVSNGPNEFILDWLLNSPNGMHLVSRVIVSPNHVKQIINTLKEKLDNYEKQLKSAQDANKADKIIQ